MRHGQKNAAALLALCLTFILLFTGCGKDPVNFIWYSSGGFRTVDPQLASTPIELTAVRHLFSGLYRLDQDGTPVPDQAVTTDISADGLVYTFTLNPDAVYTDTKGNTTPITAQDYVFGLRRAVSRSSNSPYARSFFVIEGARLIYESGADSSLLGAKALDAYTLQITLTSPDSGFLSKLCSSAAMPCNEDFFESTGGTYGLSRTTILGNGAYLLTGFTEASGLTMVKKDDASSLKIDRIRLIPTDSEDNAAQLLAGGNQDLAVVGSSADAVLMEKTGLPGQQFETGALTLVFNCSDSRLANAGIRSALAGWAQESAEGFESYDSDFFTSAEGLVPGAVKLNGESYRIAAGDVRTKYSASQRYATYQLGLGELGTTKLSGITVLIPDTEPYISLYRAINQNWQRELGAFFSVEQVSAEVLANRVAKGDFDIAVTELSPAENSVSCVLEMFVSGSENNFCAYSSEEFDQLYEAAFAASSAGQLSAWQRAEQKLLSDAPVAVLKFTNQSLHTSTGLNGIVLDPFGPVVDLSFVTTS